MPQNRDTPSLRKCLKPGWHIYWKREIYCITSCDNEKLLVYVENIVDSELGTLQIKELLRAFGDGQSAPVFAPTLERLYRDVENLHPLPASAPACGIPTNLLERAERIITTVDQVRKTVVKLSEILSDRKTIVEVARILGDRKTAMKLAEILGDYKEKYTQTDLLRIACALLNDPVGLTTYYDYENQYEKNQGDRERIAASLRRSTYNKTKLSNATLHFLDTLIPHYYRADRPSTPMLVYNIGKSALEFHTGSSWIDPDKCAGHVPEDLIGEMVMVLDEKLPMQIIQMNPDKAKFLTNIKMPSLGYFYEYIRWFESQPDLGRKVMNDRYGKGTWEKIYMVFDTFVNQATFPLQYVFADHYLLDVFIVDEATRSKIDRLWVTVLIDAYSRSILGIALLYEQPCIESIQTALLHAIWIKESHTELGIDGEWPCYGIPLQLSLDNAWAHHSHSLESLARDIGRNGKYDTIDLVFRPPYKARYGALIESFFGNLSNQIKQTLPGAIQSSDPKHVREAAKKACFLYEDIYRFLHEKVIEYQHTEHSALKMTPHQKWMEGMQTGLPLVPGLDEEMKRLFWRKSSSNRKVTTKGISAFGMNYSSLQLQALGMKERDDKADDPASSMSESTGVKRRTSKTIEYSFRYDTSDISTIALFREGRWVCDVSAKELLLPDGSLKPTSLWEVEIAKEIAKNLNGDTRDWLSYINRGDELKKRRMDEKRKMQIKLRRKLDKCVIKEDVKDENVKDGNKEEKAISESEYDDYTKLLMDFQS